MPSKSIWLSVIRAFLTKHHTTCDVASILVDFLYEGMAQTYASGTWQPVLTDVVYIHTFNPYMLVKFKSASFLRLLHIPSMEYITAFDDYLTNIQVIDIAPDGLAMLISDYRHTTCVEIPTRAVLWKRPGFSAVFYTNELVKFARIGDELVLGDRYTGTEIQRIPMYIHQKNNYYIHGGEHVTIYDKTTDKLVFTCPRCSHVDISPNGKYIAYHDKHVIHVANLETGIEMHCFQIPDHIHLHPHVRISFICNETIVTWTKHYSKGYVYFIDIHGKPYKSSYTSRGVKIAGNVFFKVEDDTVYRLLV